MKNITKGKIIKCTAIGVDVVAPLAATLSQFPIWVEKSSAATVSGLFLVFAFLSVVPFMKQLRQWLKSPSVFVLWCVFLVLFVVLRNIIDQMLIICLVGAVGNGIGSLVYKAGETVEKKPDVTDDATASSEDDREV